MINLKANKKLSVFILVFAVILLISAIYSTLSLVNGYGSIQTLNFDKKISSIIPVEDKIYVVADKNYFCRYENEKAVPIIEEVEGISAVGVYSDKLVLATDARKIKSYDVSGQLVHSSLEQTQNIVQIICLENDIFVLFNLNNKSSIKRFDYTFKELAVVQSRDSLIKAMSVDTKAQELMYVNEYGELVVTDFTMQENILSTSLEIFPSQVLFDTDGIYTVNATMGISKYDYTGKSLWDYTYDETIYKMFSANGRGVYFLDSSSRSVNFLNAKGQFQFTYKSGADTAMVVENENNVFIINNTTQVVAANANTFQSVNLFRFFNVFGIVLFFGSLILLVLTIVMSQKPNFASLVMVKTKHVALELFKSKWCYLALAPVVVLLIIFCYYPTVNSLKLAFFEYRPNSPDVFQGFKNFTYIFTSQYFTSGSLNLLKLLVTDLIKAVVPTLIFAEVIIAIFSKKFQYVSRVLLYLPAILPGVAGILIWKTGILGTDGVINSLLSSIGLDSLKTVWLSTEKTAIWAIVFIGFPWVGSYIVLYGALMGIPQSYYEAAKLDGCGYIKKIFLIDIPQIFPQIKYILIMSFIGSFQDFQRIFLTTMGSSNTQTPMLGLYTYLQNQELGYAAATGLVMFVLLFFATILTFKVDNEES